MNVRKLLFTIFATILTNVESIAKYNSESNGDVNSHAIIAASQMANTRIVRYVEKREDLIKLQELTVPWKDIETSDRGKYKSRSKRGVEKKEKMVQKKTLRQKTWKSVKGSVSRTLEELPDIVSDLKPGLELISQVLLERNRQKSSLYNYDNDDFEKSRLSYDSDKKNDYRQKKYRQQKRKEARKYDSTEEEEEEEEDHKHHNKNKYVDSAESDKTEDVS